MQSTTRPFLLIPQCTLIKGQYVGTLTYRQTNRYPTQASNQDAFWDNLKWLIYRRQVQEIQL